VSFDPFNDFEERGYLRNLFGEKDPEIIRHLEHSSFVAGVNQAFDQLAKIERLSYQDVLGTHKTLFGDMYPWAGQDRAQTAPDIAVSKGSVLFAHPDDARAAVEYALRLGHDKELMTEKPGEVMGYLAYGHPFLDGNGRTIMVVHTDLAQRAGVSIDWAATNKTEYLTALTHELEKPGKGHLDNYLKPFVKEAVGHKNLSRHVTQIHGLDGDRNQPLNANEVLGRFSDPVLQARYQAQQQRREQDDSATPSTAAERAEQANIPAEKRAEHKDTQEKSAKDFTATRDLADKRRDRNGRGGGSGRGGRGR
jgi:cell filamentation protein